jgi:branched-chain amino acid transport system permease protein
MWSIYLGVIVQNMLTGLVYDRPVGHFRHRSGGEFRPRQVRGACHVCCLGIVHCLSRRSLVALAPLAAVFFLVGYGLQITLINPFVGRPDHQQFILLVGVGLVIVNALIDGIRAGRP